MRHWIRNKRQHEKGAGIVELAFALTLFILMTAGVIDMARAMMAYSTITHATARAARYAAVRSAESDFPASTNDIEATAKSAAVGLNTDEMTVTTNWSPSNVPGATVQVSMLYNFTFVVPLLPDNLIVLSGSSSMTVSH